MEKQRDGEVMSQELLVLQTDNANIMLNGGMQ